MLLVIYQIKSLEATRFSYFRIIYNGQIVFAWKETLLWVKNKKTGHNRKYQWKESIFLFFGCQNLCAYTGILVWKSFWIRQWKVITDFDSSYMTFEYLQNDMKFCYETFILLTNFRRNVLASQSLTSVASAHYQNAAFVMLFGNFWPSFTMGNSFPFFNRCLWYEVKTYVRETPHQKKLIDVINLVIWFLESFWSVSYKMITIAKW